MRFLHLSDLHIGKKLNGISLLSDQKHILQQALALIDEYGVDAVIIAGDVYDSAFPPTEAVTLLDSFLTEIMSRKKPLFIIPGNHDSPERLSFGGRIMRSGGLFIAGVYDGEPSCVSLADEYGKINVYMLPFIRPANVNAIHGTELETYDEAVKLALSKTKISNNERNILIAHQFITAEGIASELSDSELKYAGGLDNVDFRAFDGFDYVALGHLHCPQSVGRETVAYGGSPLKYSVSERFQHKCAVIADVAEKGSVSVQMIPFEPLRDLRQIKGTLEELLEQPASDDYISVILTDAERRIEPYKRLRTVYSNCVSVEYEGDSEHYADIASPSGALPETPLEMFEQFYFERNGEKLSNSGVSLISGILDGLMGGERE